MIRKALRVGKKPEAMHMTGYEHGAGISADPRMQPYPVKWGFGTEYTPTVAEVQ